MKMASHILLAIAGFYCLLVACSSDNSPPEAGPTPGVPCYLHPAGDVCHYEQRIGSESCTTPRERNRARQNILILNRTLLSLEQQLIRLGVIPADNHCSELPPVANGGILYDNLNLSPGAVAKYICDVAYILQPLYGRYQFTCTEDGIWDGNVTEVPVECVLSPERCEPPDDIPNGNISYTNDDPSNTLVGDAITYSCEAGTELQGPAIRVCLKTGNWSSDQPECLVVDTNENKTVPDSDGHKKEIIGGTVGSGLAVILAAVVVVVIVVLYKCWHRIRGKYSNPTSSYPTLQVSNSIDADTTTSILSHEQQQVVSKETPRRKRGRSAAAYRSTEETF